WAGVVLLAIYDSARPRQGREDEILQAPWVLRIPEKGAGGVSGAAAVCAGRVGEIGTITLPGKWDSNLRRGNTLRYGGSRYGSGCETRGRYFEKRRKSLGVLGAPSFGRCYAASDGRMRVEEQFDPARRVLL